VKKDERGFIRRESDEIDPGVAATLTAGQQRQAEQQLSPSERSMLAKKREKDRERQKKRAVRYAQEKERRSYYLLDPSVIDWTVIVADDLGCSASQVAEFAIRYLAGAMQAGTINLTEYLSPAPHPRYPQLLKYPQLSDFGLNGGGNYVARKNQPRSKEKPTT